MLTIEDLVNLALRIKERARTYIGADKEFSYISAGGDTARAIDEAAQEELSKWLTERRGYPDILSEESGLIRGKEQGVLLIDPIDGSSNADRGIPFACVSIAYSSSYSLKFLSKAVILDIFREDLYYAEKSSGSFKNGSRIKVRKFRGTPVIYAPCQPDDPLIRRTTLKHIARRDLGSIALGLTYVASGQIDVLIDLRNNLRVVDLAAGLLLVKEAGGSVYVNTMSIRGLKRSLSVVAGTKEAIRSLMIPSLEEL